MPIRDMQGNEMPDWYKSVDKYMKVKQAQPFWYMGAGVATAVVLAMLAFQVPIWLMGLAGLVWFVFFIVSVEYSKDARNLRMSLTMSGKVDRNGRVLPEVADEVNSYYANQIMQVSESLSGTGQQVHVDSQYRTAYENLKPMTEFQRVHVIILDIEQAPVMSPYIQFEVLVNGWRGHTIETPFAEQFKNPNERFQLSLDWMDAGKQPMIIEAYVNVLGLATNQYKIKDYRLVGIATDHPSLIAGSSLAPDELADTEPLNDGWNDDGDAERT